MNDEPEAGDLPDFERLLEIALKAARTVAQGDDGIAEDAAQETMVSYLATDGVRDPAAWCATVAKRATLDRIRADKGIRRQKRVSRWASLGDHATAARLVEEAHRVQSPSEAVAERTVLADALDRLDDLSRQALLLREIDGLPAEQVAEKLGISRDVVYQRVHRAKQELARILSEDVE